MPNKLRYSGKICESGILVSFSGINLSLDDTYKIQFDTVNTVPDSTVTSLKIGRAHV